jgi:hypothetical protein
MRVASIVVTFFMAGCTVVPEPSLPDPRQFIGADASFLTQIYGQPETHFIDGQYQLLNYEYEGWCNLNGAFGEYREYTACTGLSSPLFGQRFKLWTYNIGSIEYIGRPTTIVSNVVGNTVYSTVREGSTYSQDSRCYLRFAVLDGIVRGLGGSGEGCP